MLTSACGLKGAVTSPHHLASQAGRDVLAEGGSAIEAMIAMAAAIAVVYPHMTGIGGDGFWLIHEPGAAAPAAISAAGQAARRATVAAYEADGFTEIPARGPRAALTAPAALRGWAAALARAEAIAAAEGRPALPLSRLLAPAAALAREGVVVTRSQAELTRAKLPELLEAPGFAPVYAPGGKAPVAGSALRQEALGATLERLGEVGLEDFYAGEIASIHARVLEEIGSPLSAHDFTAARAVDGAPLALDLDDGVVYNTPPPTQGVSSLGILGVFERVERLHGRSAPESFDWAHRLVEATKQVFILRNAGLGDPDAMAEPAAAWLAPERLDALAAAVDPARAAPWPHRARDGDTVWMGATDAAGRVVSYIQSIYWEFGSGVLSPETGVVFQNRGAGFSLTPGPNQLAPGRRPFHTLNPALARLRDGRVLAYGSMGGEGQPQTQAMIYTRHVRHGAGLQESVSAPRWLLGRTWGAATHSLKIEDRLDPGVISALAAAGHDVERIEAFSDVAGHAGAVAAHPSGLREAAGDPRADGWGVAL